MKKEELLKQIEKLPDGIEICIFDYLANSEGDNDGEDGYFEGIYMGMRETNKKLIN